MYGGKRIPRPKKGRAVSSRNAKLDERSTPYPPLIPVAVSNGKRRGSQHAICCYTIAVRADLTAR